MAYAQEKRAEREAGFLPKPEAKVPTSALPSSLKTTSLGKGVRRANAAIPEVMAPSPRSTRTSGRVGVVGPSINPCNLPAVRQLLA